MPWAAKERHAAVGCGEHASPARGTLARRQQRRGAEETRSLDQVGHVRYLDVGQPIRALRLVLDDAALDAIAGRERRVVAGARMEDVCTPAEQARVKRARAGEIARAELEVDDRVRDAACHALSLWTSARCETDRRAAMSFQRTGGPVV